MKKHLLLACAFVASGFGAKAQFTFTPQVDFGYGLLDLHKTNGISLGLGVKTGYIFGKEKNQRITATAAYDYFFGRKDSTGSSRYPAMGYVPLKLNYAFPIFESKNDQWYLEPNAGYAIMSNKSSDSYKGYVVGINFGTFDENTDLNIGLELAKFDGLEGTYGNITLRFGFLDMFSSHDTYQEGTQTVIIRKAD